MNILGRTNGSENVMLYSNAIAGVVYIAVLTLLKFIINDTQEGRSEKSRLNGSFQFANLVMINNIVDGHSISNRRSSLSNQKVT